MARKTFIAGLGLFIVLQLFSGIASAATILSWSACAGEVTGYRIYYGTTPASYPFNKEVGKVTQYPLSSLSLSEGNTYYFVIRAYNSAGESTNSNEVSWTVPDSTPPLPPAGVSCPNGSSTIQWRANTETDLKEYRVHYGTSSGSYQPFIPVGKVTTYSVANLQSGTKYYFAVTAVDNSGNESTYSAEVSSTITDSQAPVVTITAPTSSGLFNTTIATVDVAGSASDNVGVTKVTWTNSLGGSGTATGTNSWTAANVTLVAGDNRITVKAQDAAGNNSEKALTVTYLPPVVTDVVKPSVVITSPTTNSTYSTGSASISISGTASDNIGVTQVAWHDNRNGGGLASGTNSWSISNVALQEGDNVITVIAKDAAGNTGEKAITVAYAIPDTTAPAVSIVAPTSSGLYQTATPTINLSGVASDSKGVTQVKWANDRGGSDTANGTTSWSASGIALAGGINNIAITAVDAAGNQGLATLQVTYTPPDTIDPVVSILSPTNAGTYQTREASISISGSASDNVGVTLVRWANSRGGSGTATGLQNWSVSGIGLSEGENVISVSAVDAAGNTAGRNLVVTYNKPDTTLPVVTITGPSQNPYITSAATINLNGTSSDNVGVARVRWSNSRGGEGSAVGTTNWNITGVSLYEGDNVISVFAEDSAGNQGVVTKTVTYKTSNQDQAPPVINRTQPTDGTYYISRANTLNLAGTATDNVGVTLVTWASSKGGSGTAVGTKNWSVSGVKLSRGWNKITITAQDAAGNTVTDSFFVVKW